MYTYIYIYIQRERDREKEIYVVMSVFICVFVCVRSARLGLAEDGQGDRGGALEHPDLAYGDLTIISPVSTCKCMAHLCHPFSKMKWGLEGRNAFS